MPKYQIDMTVNFSGEVEADTEEEAVDYFISNREHMYYESVDSETIEEIEEDDDA
jgi:ribosomal protein L20A (L18A)